VVTATLRAALLAALAVSYIPAVAAGQEMSADSLLRRIDLLERRATELERRVRELEALKRTETSRSLPVPASPQWRDLRNWRQLRLGMSMDQVRALLGEPERVDAIGYTFWYWDYPLGPQVTFDSRTGKVNGWREPGG
jgi:hypothetical protein